MKTKRIERPFELKNIDDKGTFNGYGSVFGEVDSYRDIVLKGAFTKSIQNDFVAKGRKVPMLWQHASWQPIGVYTEVKEDDHGLYVEGQINMDVQQGREAHSLLKQGALSGLSIGYNAITEEWVKDDRVRKLHEVKLWEISPVTFPAGDSARVNSVKSFDGLISLSECEDYLRDAGLSRKEARDFVSRVRQIGPQRDADAKDAGIAAALNILKSI